MLMALFGAQYYQVWTSQLFNDPMMQSICLRVQDGPVNPVRKRRGPYYNMLDTILTDNTPLFASERGRERDTHTEREKERKREREGGREAYFCSACFLK